VTGQFRYLALDAYRGFIMLVLVSGGFGLARLADLRPEFTGIANQFDHMPWEWITFLGPDPAGVHVHARYPDARVRARRGYHISAGP
jgi:hypothetical protein